jgi:hypothetical protein
MLHQLLTTESRSRCRRLRRHCGFRRRRPPTYSVERFHDPLLIVVAFISYNIFAANGLPNR